MRDYVLLYINGKEHRIRGAEAFTPLSDYLRYELGLCGTKVVCAEGDCGACTVMLGRLNEGKTDLTYIPVNSCIQFLYQLDCAHIASIEGLKIDEQLNNVQEAMVECHGAQCGYCTPGFIVAMCAMFENKQKLALPDVKEGLTGNLCRCTGYESIINAALAVDGSQYTKLSQLHPPAPIVQAFEKHHQEPVLIEGDGLKLFIPVDVRSAAEFKSKNSDTIIVSGGTDVCVNTNKKGLEPKTVISLANMAGLDDLTVEQGNLQVGAKVTLRRLEDFCRTLIPEFYRILYVFGSPQIRHAGTLAGNIGNGSPIADTLPFLFVMDAEIEAEGAQGVRRIKINNFYKGYKTLDLGKDEIITRIIVPVPTEADVLKLYKISKREHLDISTFTAAIRLQRDNGRISRANIAYGGIAAVVVRMTKTEAFLAGKPYTIETFREGGKIAREEITPISDVRGSADFRWQLAENILQKFFYETASEREWVCHQ
ncbi:MAG TPA: FAD binding domain-containing protein [Candidatus Obscuribacterales bacterium]